MEQEMEQQFFGYGTWSARFWFIGPEQGKGRDESDSNVPRAAAWNALGMRDLCDCLEFHRTLGDLRCFEGPKPPLQSTWRPLILTLLAMKGDTSAVEDRRRYQMKNWGRSGGETCLIELSGTASRRLSSPEALRRHRRHRLSKIAQELTANSPEAVVMYGLGELEAWSEIAGNRLSPDIPVLIGRTVFVATPHPQTRGRKNTDWVRLADGIRAAMVRS
jgi:hypothetical protein